MVEIWVYIIMQCQYVTDGYDYADGFQHCPNTHYLRFDTFADKSSENL